MHTHQSSRRHKSALLSSSNLANCIIKKAKFVSIGASLKKIKIKVKERGHHIEDQNVYPQGGGNCQQPFHIMCRIANQTTTYAIKITRTSRILRSPFLA
jgi:hypothetical protein